jgi:hypothetical protein
MKAYFVEHDKRIVDIDFFIANLSLEKIPIVLQYEGGLIPTTYSINVWIPTGERIKVDPENPPLLYSTKDSFQIYVNSANEISMLWSEGLTLGGLKWINENRAEITLIEKMKIEQLDINKIRNNRWLVYSPERFPSDLHAIKYKLDQEMWK